MDKKQELYRIFQAYMGYDPQMRPQDYGKLAFQSKFCAGHIIGDLEQAVFAGFFPALIAVWQLAQTGKTAVVSIDGRCGSGKTTLAALIAELFPCNIFHMDDFYIPVAQRSSDWAEIPAGNMDIDRFLKEALLPAKRGEAIKYRPFNCRRGDYLPAVTVAAAPLTVVEGSYSQHPLLSEHYDLKIFLTCSGSEQERRLLVREGENIQVFRNRWIPMEELYLKTCDIEQNSSMVLDTGTL